MKSARIELLIFRLQKLSWSQIKDSVGSVKFVSIVERKFVHNFLKIIKPYMDIQHVHELFKLFDLELRLQ